MYELFGRDPALGPAVGDALLAYVHPDDRERVAAGYADAFGGRPQFSLDFGIVASGGTERVLVAHGYVDPHGSGRYLGTFQDVSDQRRAERERLELEADRARADSANQAKTEFLARMSHELRTPLNAILGFGQLLELELTDPRQREDLGYIVKAGKHLLELIHDVLDIARIETGKMTISPEAVSIISVAREVLGIVAPLAAERGITLHRDLSGVSGDQHVLADGHRLKQVLINVLSNAIKYNRAGGDVAFSVTDPGGGRILTAIADTGIGIEPDRIDELFEPFQRLGAERTSVEGTGLGLTLSKGLLTEMGGSVAVTSEPGVGTTFVIDLATADFPHAGQPSVIGDHALSPLTDAHPVRPRILHIEDNDSNRRLVGRILAARDVDLINATDGAHGLQIARDHHPDLIVLDLHLPDMPGLDVLTHLRAGHPEIPVIVLTADATRAQADRVRRLGAADYLTKPLDVGRFIEAIATHLSAPPGNTAPAQARHTAS
jgi:signal transduction histidine kinase/CheY-like chemotaxis protein